MTGRDEQRSRVYAAERVVRRIFDRASAFDARAVQFHGSSLTLPVERRFADVPSMQRYVDLLRGLRWVREAWPERAGVPVTVRPRAGQAAAHYERITATIAIPQHERNRAWAMRELVLLHEIAHHLGGELDGPPHGGAFADRYLRLVGDVIGTEAGLLLRSAMHDSGVRLQVIAGVSF